MRTLYFLSGLPRSGSTLLCNLLMQNPRFHATPTSGLIGAVSLVWNSWEKQINHQAAPDTGNKLTAIRGLIGGYHNADRPVVFDKNRGWPSMIEQLEAILGHQVKIIATMRDVRDVVASMELRWRETRVRKAQIDELNAPLAMQTIESRVGHWMSAQGVVGSSLNCVLDAIHRGMGDRILLVPYENLTSHPRDMMTAIYGFLEEESFDHQFTKIEQVTEEEEDRHGYDGLHQIEPSLRLSYNRWRGLIPQYIADSLKRHNFWVPREQLASQ